MTEEEQTAENLGVTFKTSYITTDGREWDGVNDSIIWEMWLTIIDKLVKNIPGDNRPQCLYEFDKALLKLLKD